MKTTLAIQQIDKISSNELCLGQNKYTSLDTTFTKYKATTWLMRLFEFKINYNDDFFIYYEYCTNSLTNTINRAIKHLEKMQEELTLEEDKKLDKSSKKKNKARKHEKSIISKIEESLYLLEQLKEEDSSYKFREIEDVFNKNSIIREILLKEMLITCQNTVKELQNELNSKKNNHFYTILKIKLQEIFGLSDNAYSLCEYFYIADEDRSISNYLNNELEIVSYRARGIFSHILSMSNKDLVVSMEYLTSCGFINDVFGSSLSNNINEFIRKIQNEFECSSQDASIEDVSSLFNQTDSICCKPLNNSVLPLEAFAPTNLLDIDKKTKKDIKPTSKKSGVLGKNGAKKLAHVCNLLSKKNTDKNEPVHILLYGYPGTGKTSFANSLAKHLDVKAWAVNCLAEDSDASRRSSLVACMHLASQHKNSYVLVDEAERLLDTDLESFRETKDKAWLNNFLEEKNRRVIWITNRIWHIDDAVRRRFTYSIFFDSLGKNERIALWQRLLKEKKASNLIKSNAIEKLAKKYEIPVSIIDKAITTAKAHYNSKEEFEKGLRISIDSFIRLQHNGYEKPKKKKSKVKASKDYTLEGVNFGSSPSTLIEKCKEINKLYKKELPRSAATMLFYGAPGTGKTALARYIAQSINKPCIVKKASDLLSKFVGETEANIAKAFKEAKKKNAVLVIDEADSFLYSREKAVNPWEASMVNEFLTALEDCRSFCICTTNRRKELDPAVMRRFSYKLEFKYSSPKEVLALYKALLAPLCSDKLTSSIQSKLKNFTRLAPGDFHVVRTQYSSLFADTNNVSHAELIEALQREEKLKLDATEKTIGFCK